MLKVAKYNGIFALLSIAIISLLSESLAQQAGPATQSTESQATAAAQATPAPLAADAGVDRVVVLPGKTYLNGWAGQGSRPRPGRRRTTG